MRLVVRIEADAETGDFHVAYLTGAAEWSLDPAAAFRGTREECETLAGKQPLRGMLGWCESPSLTAARSASPKVSPADAFAFLEERGLA